MNHVVSYEPSMKYYDDMIIKSMPDFLSGKLKDACYDKVMDFDVSYAYSEEPVPFSEMTTLKFVPIKVGEAWAKKNFACAWFRLTARLPEGTEKTGLCVDFVNDGEGLLVDPSGHPVKGFTVGSPTFGIVDDAIEKRFYPIEQFFDEQGYVELYIDGASNSLLGEFIFDAARLQSASIVRKNPKMLDIYWDFDTLLDYVTGVDWNDPNRLTVVQGLRSVQNLVNYGDPEAYEKAKKITTELLQLPGTENLQATAVAHAHLDLAWLWPIRESKRKAKRTFANLIDLAKQYPNFRFAVPQPQQLEWIKNEEPAQYEALKELAAKGQMEPVGGAWVENDTNIPGEESLARQMLYGQKFWQKEFGHYVKIGWLPDAFGYTGALPQVLKLAGQDSFMTIKISWSNRTVFPYNTFRWAGIDGSEVTVHMPPEGNYNSVAGPKALLNAKKGIKKTDPQDRMMVVYGVGDGGGGPSETNVERCLRTENVPYLPKVRLGTAQGYFDSLKGLDLPRYQGEMYLEKHRATYTSQSNNKYSNREFEEKMTSLEAMLACQGIQGDKKAMDALWKEALLYQFHDILPGSSINRVYDETDAAYAEMMEKLEAMANGCGLSFNPGKALLNPAGEAVFRLEKNGEGYLLYQGSERLIDPVSYENPAVSKTVSHVETDYYQADFHSDGSFASIKLPSGEVMLEQANRLRVFIDLGDAWDFEDDYRDQPEQYMELISSENRSFGDLIEVRQTYGYKNSKLVQTIVMHRHDPCIRITHDFDWKDTGYMVRAEFQPTHWSDVVHSDIQYGYLDRPTIDRNEHEKAQFEICCQKWFDLSDDQAGVAILNNAKSGFMVKRGVISVDLLRSTNYPCLDSDQKHSHYCYAIYPHSGGFDPVQVDKLAQQFNARSLYGDAELEMPSFDNEQIQITAYKPACDGNGFILRAFERSGSQTVAHLTLPTGYELVEEVNLLEDPVTDVGKEIFFHPFQIRSFRIRKV